MRSLTRSITRTIGLLFVLQAAVIGTSFLVYRLPAARSGFFVLAALLYHALLLSILLALRPLFVLEADDSPLERVNASNALSLVRLSSLPAIVFLIISARDANMVPVILPYLVLVFLTDLLDGRLARSLNQITRIGRYLDSVSDYMLLTATLFVYLSYVLIPWWFFLLVIVRLGVVAAGNTLLYVAQGFVEPETSYLSKASIFSIMLLFAAKILSIPYGLLFRGPSPLTLERLDTLQLMVAGVLIVSTFEKINLIGNRLKGTSGAATGHLRPPVGGPARRAGRRPGPATPQAAARQGVGDS